MHWELPDGTLGLSGIRTSDLPLFGAAAAHRWDPDEPVIVCEGEKAAAHVTKAGYQAVGTVTGAAGCPNREPLTILAGFAVLLWPDNDDAGVIHMLKVAREVLDLAASVHWIVWRDAPPGGDAADAFAQGGRELIDSVVALAGDVPEVEPSPAQLIDFAQADARHRARFATSRRREVLSPIARFNSSVSVTEVLAEGAGMGAPPALKPRTSAAYTYKAIGATLDASWDGPERKFTMLTPAILACLGRVLYGF